MTKAPVKRKKNPGKRLGICSAVLPEQKQFVGKIESHFLDSGAFTLKVAAQQYAADNPGKTEWDFYDTPDHWDYLDDYAKFVNENLIAIDYYANVDVMPNSEGTPNPKLTYRNQKFLEKEWGLKPVPVVHYKTDLKWLHRYINEGYDIIGLGGLVGSTAGDSCRAWIDRCFDIVCDTPDRLPKVKLHGFGVTVYDLMIRYPWFSVDSTSWTKIGAYGGILVPHKRRGKWVFNEQPYLLKVSMDSPDAKLIGRHFLNLTKAEQDICKEWCSFIGMPMGEFDENRNLVTAGVITHHAERRAANLLFFEMMRKSLPEYPWAFNSKRRKGFGLYK
jgi:hypothetical protein